MNTWVFFRRARIALFCECRSSEPLVSPLVSHQAVSSHSFLGFDLPHMDNPHRRLRITRVVPFFSIPECVRIEYEHA
jgi:hypothetical protein